ncbi:flagellar basal body rod protein FlgF [Massilia sp. Root335]|jgi:flagellar basal-body rod protein FlgF|uniref:flagellar basal body rod protein FlgF n=1 Tax=Massilia sp. Root335 TaxID=1736517 RepID=UPI0006F9F40B|nr:flagellar basal body rod protein FlgF [Massilia sp. Root335]KQV49985.1 flagellar biosynthesis protein FlgF [Massilia sp. Root335]
MDKLIFTAVSGAERLMRSQQIHANNLANLDTTGFRSSMEVATQQQLGGFGYDDRHMSSMQADMISTRAGAVHETGRPLDVAIGGQGYLAVQYGDSEAYTRSGEIEIGSDGALSVHGHPLLGEGGPIVLPQHTAVEIGTDGTISVLTEGATQMQVVDKLKLVNATGAELTKNEAGLIVSRDGGNLPTDPDVKVRPRALEGSNVSAVEEMVATMSLNRSFEVQMRLFKASDSMNETGNKLIAG